MAQGMDEGEKLYGELEDSFRSGNYAEASTIMTNLKVIYRWNYQLAPA